MLVNFNRGVVAEYIGPIQIGLNKPVLFISVEPSVRDIVNLATIAAMNVSLAQEAGTAVLDQ